MVLNCIDGAGSKWGACRILPAVCPPPKVLAHSAAQESTSQAASLSLRKVEHPATTFGLPVADWHSFKAASLMAAVTPDATRNMRRQCIASR